MEGGVGARGYAVIEQGKVEQLLNAKPQDRRFVVEEVAGITKYKARKTEALNKLEATRQNLLRVNDIMTEIRRQMASLERQAKRRSGTAGTRTRSAAWTSASRPSSTASWGATGRPFSVSSNRFTPTRSAS